MLLVAILLFVVAALTGVALAVQHVKSQAGGPVPKLGLAFVHGAFAASGLGLLALAAAKGEAKGLALAALAIFVVAALGGFYLFARHAAKKPLPKALLVVHGGAAAVAFVLLVISKLA